MKKMLFVPLPACFLLLQSAPPVTAQPDCEPVEVPAQCQPVDQININTNTHKISPRNICAAPGQEIEVKVSPEGSVRIQGKSGWPTGEGETFTIIAPESGEYDYNVYFEDGICIDPRVTVR